MTRKEPIKILGDKIEANKRQYDLDRKNGKISAYSSGDLPKYEYLTKKYLGYKPDAFEQATFEYSPLGKIFTDGLTKEDKSKNIGLFKRLKNIEDNLAEADDNDNKVGIFRIIKDIKDKDIKIDNDDEAIGEIREHIKKLTDDEVKVNNFDEMKEEIIEHLQNLEEKGIDVKIDENQINDLINKIFNKKDAGLNDVKKKLTKYRDTISTTYNKNKINTEIINNEFIKYFNGRIRLDQFIEKYNKFKNGAENFKDEMSKKEKGAFGKNQEKMLEYYKELGKIIGNPNPKEGSGINKEVQILNIHQMFSRLPIILAQIQAGNNSQSLKNELRQLIIYNKTN